MTAKELREKRAKAIADLRVLVDKADAEKREFSADEKAQYDRVNGEIDTLQAKITERARLEVLESETAAAPAAAVGREDVRHEPAKDDESFDARSAFAAQTRDTANVVQGWLRAAADLEPRAEHIESAKRVGVRLNRKTLDIRLGEPGLVEKRDLTVTTTAGGYLIPQGFVPRLEQAMLAYGSVRNVAEVLRTDSGNALPWPTANDTTNTGEFIAINSTIGSSVDPAFGQFLLNAYKCSSKLILVPPELLEDSAFPLANLVFGMLGERLARIQNTAYTTYDGSSKVDGIVHAATAGVTTTSATAITTDEILDLIHSVDPAYRPGASFMMHDGVVKYLRKLKDGEGRYVWQQGLAAGAPSSIFGYPVVVNQDMDATVASTNDTMLFGQLSAYKVREVNAVRLRRLDERYADTDQVGFVALMRVDGDLLDAGTHPVKLMTQHA